MGKCPAGEWGSAQSALGGGLTWPESEEGYSPGVPRPSANIFQGTERIPFPTALLHPPPHPTPPPPAAPWVTECTDQIFIKVLLSET